MYFYRWVRRNIALMQHRSNALQLRPAGDTAGCAARSSIELLLEAVRSNTMNRLISKILSKFRQFLAKFHKFLHPIVRNPTVKKHNEKPPGNLNRKVKTWNYEKETKPYSTAAARRRHHHHIEEHWVRHLQNAFSWISLKSLNFCEIPKKKKLPRK